MRHFENFSNKIFSALNGMNIRVLEESSKDSLKKGILLRLKSERRRGGAGRSQGFGALERPAMFMHFIMMKTSGFVM